MNAKHGHFGVDFAAISAVLLVASSLASAQQSVAAARSRQISAHTAAEVRELYDQHRYADAARAAEALVKEHKDDPDAWMVLATVHLAGEWGMRKDTRAEFACERALKLKGRKPEILEALATAKFRQVKFDECVPIVAELCDSTPPLVRGESYADLLVIRANVAFKRDALDPAARAGALADLERAIQEMPGHSGARTLRAEALAQDGKYEAALADLQVAKASAPGSKHVHYLLHTVLLRLGRRDEAKQHYEIWKLLNRLTDSIAITAAPEARDRLELLRKLRALNPADLERRLAFAQIALDLGEADVALAECTELLALDPGSAGARWLKGEAQRVKAGGAPRPSADDAGDGG